METAMFVRLPFPVLITVMNCDALVAPTRWRPKVTEAGASVTGGAAPVPATATAWGLFVAVSVMLSVPLIAPVVVGEKKTLITQEAFAARALPQSLVREKAPETEI